MREFDVTYIRYGTCRVMADNEEDAWREAARVSRSDIYWDYDFDIDAIDNAEKLEEAE